MSSATDTTDDNAGYRDLQHLAHWPKTPKPMPGFQRFPALLTHPEHVDAVPERNETVRVTPPGGLQVDRIEFVHTPGVPEQYPPVIVHNDAEVAAAVAQGYTAPVWNEATTDQTPPTQGQEYPKYIAAHDKIVNSYAEEIALLPPAERAAAEAARAARKPTLADYNNDVEAFSQAVVAWHMAQQAKPAAPSYTPAQARAAAHVSESRWTSLIAGGWLAEADKCSPDAITRAVAARDAVDTGIINS